MYLILGHVCLGTLTHLMLDVKAVIFVSGCTGSRPFCQDQKYKVDRLCPISQLFCDAL